MNRALRAQVGYAFGASLQSAQIAASFHREGLVEDHLQHGTPAVAAGTD